MDTSEIHSLVTDLSANISSLEDSLAPLLKSSLSTSTSKLPLLDKAKLHVLATYALESLLFSSLRLNGVDAKAHPVFQELGRTREYFEKIKRAEGVGQRKRGGGVDKDAVGRFIKQGLAGNERFDRERTAGGKRKLEGLGVGTYTRFDGVGKSIRASEGGEDGIGSGNESNAFTRELAKEDKKAVKRQRQRGFERRLGGVTDPQNEPVVISSDAPDNGNDGDDVVEVKPPMNKRSRAPRSTNETFQALLQGSSSPSGEEKMGGKKKKSRQTAAAA